MTFFNLDSKRKKGEKRVKRSFRSFMGLKRVY